MDTKPSNCPLFPFLLNGAVSDVLDWFLIAVIFFLRERSWFPTGRILTLASQFLMTSLNCKHYILFFILGTLNPALQDRHGRPKRDISTIIHILNDLLCATPQYRAKQEAALAAAATSSSSLPRPTIEKMEINTPTTNNNTVPTPNTVRQTQPTNLTTHKHGKYTHTRLGVFRVSRKKFYTGYPRIMTRSF